jgi:predicted dehydrogenase
MAHRVAIIGCGRIAWAHALGWQVCAGTDVVALADPDPAALARLGDAYGVAPAHRYDDYHSLFATESVDVASICVWTGRHLGAVVAASDAGVRLIVTEKPMADNIGHAQAMLMAAASAGAKLSVSHQRRFYPAWSMARELVAGGAIGEPTLAWTRTADGLLNNATHGVDLIRYVLGDPAGEQVVGSVQRATDRYERGARAEDSALGLVIFDNGTRAFIESEVEPGAKPIANALVHGSEGSLRVHEGDVQILGPSTAGWRAVSPPPAGEEPWADASNPGMAAMHTLIGHHLGPDRAVSFARTFVDQAHDAVAWLDGDHDEHRCEARHGYAAIEIVLAIYESVRQREVTRLPLRTRANPLDLLVESGDLPVTRPGVYDIRAVTS